MHRQRRSTPEGKYAMKIRHAEHSEPTASSMDIMGDELKTEMGEDLKVDLRRLNPKLRRLTESQTVAILDAADACMLGRRWIPTGRKDIKASGLVRTPEKKSSSQAS